MTSEPPAEEPPAEEAAEEVAEEVAHPCATTMDLTTLKSLDPSVIELLGLSFLDLAALLEVTEHVKPGEFSAVRLAEPQDDDTYMRALARNLNFRMQLLGYWVELDRFEGWAERAKVPG